MVRGQEEEDHGQSDVCVWRVVQRLSGFSWQNKRHQAPEADGCRVEENLQAECEAGDPELRRLPGARGGVVALLPEVQSAAVLPQERVSIVRGVSGEIMRSTEKGTSGLGWST